MAQQFLGGGGGGGGAAPPKTVGDPIKPKVVV